MSSKAKLVKRLADKILKAKSAYYTSSNPIMSDAEYDALEMSLEYLCPSHPILELVGYDISGEFKKLSLKDTESLINQ
jgi:NAD-dependent DNA ligase